MLDFRSGSSSTPYYRQRVDYGRLVMMVVSSILLMSLILTFGRPRHAATAPTAGGSNTSAAKTATESNSTLVGIAVLVGSLCAVACVMLVLHRMVRPGRVRFAIHDVGGPPPDFSALEAQPPVPTPGEVLANIAIDNDTQPGPTLDPNGSATASNGDPHINV
jgi:hypothetical protein